MQKRRNTKGNASGDGARWSSKAGAAHLVFNIVNIGIDNAPV